jgi:hypothetical protein
MSDPPGPDDGRIVTRVRRGGSTEYGRYIQFELEFADGTTEDFRCLYEQMPHLMNGLRGVAQIVEQVRSGNPDPSLDTANPYRMTSARIGQAVDGSVAIQFWTTEGNSCSCLHTPRPSGGPSKTVGG